MKITVKFFSSLMEYLPEGTDGNAAEVNAAGAMSANEALARFKVPAAEVRTVMKNGAFLPEDQRDDPLADGDVLTVWPAIQGG